MLGGARRHVARQIFHYTTFSRICQAIFQKKIAQILIPKFMQFYLLTLCGDRVKIGYIRGQENNPPPQKIFQKK
jgi:hypothetical protein